MDMGYVPGGLAKTFVCAIKRLAIYPAEFPSSRAVEETGSMENPRPLNRNRYHTSPPFMEDTPSQNNLSKDVHVKGSIKFVSELIFDGTLEGEIRSVDGVLTVGENANVRGDVMGKIAIVNGKVHGNITVRERCELHACSQLIGDLKAVHLVIEGGATFVGKSEVTPSRGAIKDVAVAQKGEPQKIGAPR